MTVSEKIRLICQPKNIVKALGMATDYIVSDNQVRITDMYLLKKIEVKQNNSGDTWKEIDAFLFGAIRDFKVKQAYAS